MFGLAYFWQWGFERTIEKNKVISHNLRVPKVLNTGFEIEWRFGAFGQRETRSL